MWFHLTLWSAQIILNWRPSVYNVCHGTLQDGIALYNAIFSRQSRHHIVWLFYDIISYFKIDSAFSTKIVHSEKLSTMNSNQTLTPGDLVDSRTHASRPSLPQQHFATLFDQCDVHVVLLQQDNATCCTRRTEILLGQQFPDWIISRNADINHQLIR